MESLDLETPANVAHTVSGVLGIGGKGNSKGRCGRVKDREEDGSKELVEGSHCEEREVLIETGLVKVCLMLGRRERCRRLENTSS